MTEIVVTDEMHAKACELLEVAPGSDLGLRLSASRTAIPALIAEIARLKKELAEEIADNSLAMTAAHIGGFQEASKAAQAEIERLTKERDGLQLSHDEEAAEIASAIGDRFMLDSPDGGCITLLEAAERIASALSAAEAKVEKMRAVIAETVEWADRHGKEPSWLDAARAALEE